MPIHHFASRLITASVSLTLLIGCAAQVAHPVGGLSGLDAPRSFTSMRHSSADPDWRNGNGDCRPIIPGDTLTLAEMEGPARIVHIWFTVAAKDRFFPRGLVVRMYWDGEEDPSVEAPLGDFFGVGHGLRLNLDSQPVAISAEGRAYNCYWPMPFHRSARITVTNDSTEPVIGFFWYLDYQKLGSLPADTPTFHAQYRQEYPCDDGDYLILDAEGKGHYVGTVLSVRQHEGGWFGEGDDRFYIDGEEEPSIRGTGSEDYFCDAWAFREFNRPYFGVPRYDGMVVGGLVSAYRWHIPDPIAFDKSLRVTIEHKGTRTDLTGRMTEPYNERPDDFSSVAFWYQTGRAKRFASVPGYEERVMQCVAFEPEDWWDGLAEKPSDTMFQALAGSCSGRGQVLFTRTESDWTAEIPFEVERSGSYTVKLVATTAPDFGTFTVLLDGQAVRTGLDLYTRHIITSEEFRLGLKHLEAGPHTIRFECTGANPDSRLQAGGPGHYLGFDAINLYPLDAE